MLTLQPNSQILISINKKEKSARARARAREHIHPIHSFKQTNNEKEIQRTENKQCN
jgi:hypothetical protein